MQQAQTVPAPKLREPIFFAYGTQEFAMGFLTMLGVQFIGFFLTNTAFYGVVGGAAIAATILAVGRFVDIFTVPVVGVIVEKSNMRWGKYRSWIYIACPLVVIFTMLMFTDFGFASVNTTAVVITIWYLLMFIAINFVSTGRMSLLPVFTRDPDERAKLSARRAQGAAIGTGIRGFITLPLVIALGGGAAAHLGGRNSQGFVLTSLVYGIFLIAGLYWIAALAKPYDKPYAVRAPGAPKPATVGEMIKTLVTNRPLLVFILANTFTLTATNILTGFNLFYFRYVVGDLMFFQWYMPVIFGGQFIGNTIATRLARKVGNNRNVYMIGMAIYAIFISLIFFVGADNAYTFTALVAIAQLGNGLAIGLTPAIFSDTADYGELKGGKSVRAAVMALVIFPIKIGVFLGGSIAAFALVVIGFVAGSPTPEVISGIQFWATLPNAGFAVLALIIMLAYPLSRSKMDEIQQQLKDRAAAQAQGQ